MNLDPVLGPDEAVTDPFHVDTVLARIRKDRQFRGHRSYKKVISLLNLNHDLP